jgi:hypothetical protein
MGFFTPPRPRNRKNGGGGHGARHEVDPAGSNMPWEQPLNQILQSIEGPVTKVVSVIIIMTSSRSR